MKLSDKISTLATVVAVVTIPALSSADPKPYKPAQAGIKSGTTVAPLKSGSSGAPVKAGSMGIGKPTGGSLTPGRPAAGSMGAGKPAAGSMTIGKPAAGSMAGSVGAGSLAPVVGSFMTFENPEQNNNGYRSRSDDRDSSDSRSSRSRRSRRGR